MSRMYSEAQVEEAVRDTIKKMIARREIIVGLEYETLADEFRNACDRLQSVLDALRNACDRLQSFLDTFGDLGDRETQADLNDWRDATLTPANRNIADEGMTK